MTMIIFRTEGCPHENNFYPVRLSESLAVRTLKQYPAILWKENLWSPIKINFLLPGQETRVGSFPLHNNSFTQRMQIHKIKHKVKDRTGVEEESGIEGSWDRLLQWHIKAALHVLQLTVKMTYRLVGQIFHSKWHKEKATSRK